MATLSRFEDLKIWQESRKLNQVLFEFFIDQVDKKFGFLINHIYKTSGSIMDNIAEGFEREGNKEFILFLSYSKGSAGELRSQLYRALDLKLITASNLETLLCILISVSNQLSLFMKYLRNSEFKGNKFREPNVDYKQIIKLDQFVNPQNDTLQ
jgi:four helix bundle protein